MFSNLFDTVRSTHLDHIQMEGTFMKAILNHNCPALSLNMLVDSPLVLALAQKHPEFLDLAEQQVIRASLYGKLTGIMDYLRGHLENAHEKTKDLYKFSSLPFLIPGVEFEETHIRKIYNAMWIYLQGGPNQITAALVPDYNQRCLIHTSLEVIRSFSRKLDGHYILPAKNNNSPILSQRIDAFAAKLRQQTPDIILPAELENLQARFVQCRIKHGIDPAGSQDKNVSEPLFTSRSLMYKTFQINGETPENETKAIIDLCYNETVAASLQDNEDDLMVNPYSYSTLDQYLYSDETPLHSHCISCIDAADGYQGQYFTWEIVKAIHDEATRCCKQKEDWNETVARCCEEYGLPAFEPGIDSGSQPIAFIPTVLSTACDTDYSIYQEETRDFLRKNAGNLWSMDTDNPNAVDTNPDEPSDFRETSATMKEDYAQGAK